MNRLRQLLALLLLMVSGNMAAEYFACEYVEPFLIATDNGAGRTKLVGLRMDPSIKTLVIPNKINGNEVCDVINRHWWFYSKPRYESWGNQYQRKMEFSLFERNCNMQTYEDDWPRFDVNPFAGTSQIYPYGSEPEFDKDAILGERLYLEEIVFPREIENFFSQAYLKGLSSLKRVYMRRTGWIVNFGIDLTGCDNLEEIHLMCDVPHYVVDDSKIPHKINLYVPQKYYNNYMADPDWANSPSFNVLPEPTNGATLKIKNTYPGLLVTIDGIDIYGYDSPGYVSTMNFGKYYMPRYKVSYGGVGAIKVTLNGQSLDDFENEDALLDLVPGENILELELVNSSEVTLNSNGNGSTVKWNGKQVLGNAGGTYKLEDVKSDASNTLVVNYAPSTQELTVKKGSATLTPTSNSGGTATFEIGKVMTDCNIDVQVKDKLCNITVSKTTVDGDLKVVRSVDGKAYFTYLIDDMTFQAGRGTTISIDVPNTMILTTAQLGGVNMTKTTHSNGVSTYTATVPSSTAATLRLVGQRVTASTSYLDYSLQTITKIGNGTVNYLKWHTDNQNNVREESGVLTTPVSTFLAPFGYDENGNGWTLTIKPDTGYELTTLYGTWGQEAIQGVSVPKSYNMLSEPAYIDNATGTTYNNHDGPTVGQKRAAGGDFSLDLEVGRTISYDASTHTYTFTVKGADWDGEDMAITIGFSNPNESSKKQMSVVAVGTPTDGELILEYSLASNNTQHSEVLLTSAGSTTKEYQLGDFKYIYFFMNYEGGHDLEGSSPVPMPFTVYHNGVDVTSQFEYDDREIYGPLTDVTMEGNWTFVFPDGNQATDAKWSFLKSGEGSLSCEIVPTGTSVEPTTRIIGNSSEILRLQKDEVQSVIVKVQTADGNTFKAFCNGSDVTSNFTLSGSEYTLTTNQADLKDANWTVLFTEGQAANTFTYQFSQTTGGEVLVGVVPVGDTSADIKSIQEGSMTLSLTSDEAQGVILFVEPEDNMAVRIYSGETDVTSQFTYDSSSNSYMRQTTSLANETLLFVFADKNELGVANPNLLTQHIQLTGEQLGNVWMQYLDSDGADYDDAYAGNEHPYVTFTSEDKIYIKGAKPCITVPNGYTFKAYFNGQEVTDFTLENNYYVATLDESFVADGTWVVEFKNADSGGSNEVVAVLTPDRNTPLYLTNSSGEDVLFAFLNTEIGTITKGGDYTINVRSYNPHSWKTNLRVNGVDRTADLVTNSENANEMLLPLTNITESLNVEAFYTSRRSIVSLYTTEGGTTKIEYTDNETGEAASRTYSNGDYSNDRIVNGTEVIFTFTPDQGYKLSKVFAMSDRWIGEGDDYEVKLQADGSYRFVLSSGDFIDGLASITVHFEKKGGPYDVNNDGNITIGDVTKLVNVILGKE